MKHLQLTVILNKLKKIILKLLNFIILLVPLSIDLVKEGSTILSNLTNQKKFSLKCITSLNRNFSVVITWLKNDVEISNDFSYVVRNVAAKETYAGSILEFRTLTKDKIFDYKGEYKCRVLFKYVDVGQSNYYLSQPEFIKFTYNGFVFQFFLLTTFKPEK